jgi:hypothetical protein
MFTGEIPREMLGLCASGLPRSWRRAGSRQGFGPMSSVRSNLSGATGSGARPMPSCSRRAKPPALPGGKKRHRSLKSLLF